MRVEQWMTTDPYTVEPHASVACARALLKEHRINQLPVTLSGRLVGIVTDRDLRDAMGTMCVAAEAAGDPLPQRRSAEKIAIEAVMTANAISVEPDDTIERAAVLMRDIQELSYQEIADVLRLPEGTVKSRIRSGLRRLKQLLDE